MASTRISYNPQTVQGAELKQCMDFLVRGTEMLQFLKPKLLAYAGDVAALRADYGFPTDADATALIGLLPSAADEAIGAATGAFIAGLISRAG